MLSRVKTDGLIQQNLSLTLTELWLFSPALPVHWWLPLTSPYTCQAVSRPTLPRRMTATNSADWPWLLPRASTEPGLVTLAKLSGPPTHTVHRWGDESQDLHNVSGKERGRQLRWGLSPPHHVQPLTPEGWGPLKAARHMRQLDGTTVGRSFALR